MRRTIINKFFAVSFFHHFVKVNLHFFTQCRVYMHNNCFLAANASKENLIFMAFMVSTLPRRGGEGGSEVLFRNRLTVAEREASSTKQALHCDAAVCKRAVCLCKDIFRQSIFANLADSCFPCSWRQINEKLRVTGDAGIIVYLFIRGVYSKICRIEF